MQPGGYSSGHRFYGVDGRTLDNPVMNSYDERKKEISYKINFCGICFCGFMPINIFNFNNKFMLPVRQIQSGQILAKNKIIMAKTNRLNPGGSPKGRIEGEPILAFPDTPAVSESGKAEKQAVYCILRLRRRPLPAANAAGKHSARSPRGEEYRSYSSPPLRQPPKPGWLPASPNNKNKEG